MARVILSDDRIISLIKALSGRCDGPFDKLIQLGIDTPVPIQEAARGYLMQCWAVRHLLKGSVARRIEYWLAELAIYKMEREE